MEGKKTRGKERLPTEHRVLEKHKKQLKAIMAPVRWRKWSLLVSKTIFSRTQGPLPFAPFTKSGSPLGIGKAGLPVKLVNHCSNLERNLETNIPLTITRGSKCVWAVAKV